MYGFQNFPLFIYLYMFRVCFYVDRYVCETDDRDVIPVRVVKKNLHYSVARSHPHSILLDLS